MGGKVFAVFHEEAMAFKLSGESHAEALAIEGAQLFDPRGEGHPMKAWVQIPTAASSTWKHFVRLAYEYVAGEAQGEKDALIQGLGFEPGPWDLVTPHLRPHFRSMVPHELDDLLAGYRT